MEGGAAVCIGRMQTDENDNVSGSGNLVYVKLKGLARGCCYINIESISILDEDGEDVPFRELLLVNPSMLLIE